MNAATEVSTTDFGDGWNPLFVKELRQSLRSRGFTVLFVLTQLVGAATAVAALLWGDPGPDLGPTLLTALATALGLGIVVVIPIFAFQSLAQEFEENTLDLLLLSQLGPGRIVLGKLFSALSQVLLLAISFAPYFAICLLLEGVDLILPATLLVSAVCLSAAATCVALGLASLARSRALRSALLGILTLALLFISMALLPALGQLVRQTQILRAGEFWGTYWILFVLLVFLAAMALMTSRAHLSHPEEAATMPARTIALIGAVVLPFAIYALPAARGMMDGNPGLVAMVALLVLVPAAVSFATERGSMGRVLARQLRGRRAYGLGAFLVLPGAGRGALCALALFILVGASSNAANAVFGTRASSGFFLGDSLAKYAVLASYAWIYLVPVSLICSLFGKWPAWRWVARLAYPLLAIVSILGGMLIGSILGDERMSDGYHLLNPVTTWGEMSSGFADRGVRALFAIAAAMTLFMVPRWIMNVREVLRATAPAASGAARPVGSTASMPTTGGN